MKKSVIILIHIGFWLFVYTSSCIFKYIQYIPYLENDEFNPLLYFWFYKTIILSNVFIPLIFYISYSLVPFFTKRPRLIGLPVVVLVLSFFLLVKNHGTDTYRFIHSAFEIISFFSFIILGCLFRIFEEWFKSKKVKNQLEKQNLKSELALLKNQISPHFFFNTLNNIDSLMKSNTDKASETLVKLSEIMRYMIYDTNIDKVDLSNEIKHLESYIDLQKIQYVNNELVSFSVKGNSETISVAPMLFIPFVENAFKHCTDKNISNAISIAFEIDNNRVNFECINMFDKTLKITKDTASGIGLNIIKRRLEIIYPDKHSLNIIEENNTFKVTLSLKVNEN